VISSQNSTLAPWVRPLPRVKNQRKNNQLPKKCAFNKLSSEEKFALENKIFLGLLMLLEVTARVGPDQTRPHPT